MAAIDVIRAYDLNFALGNVIKYTLRAGRKPDEDAVKDLEKAVWYLQNELDAARRLAVKNSNREAAVTARNVGLGSLAARESAGEWGGVVVPPSRDELDAILNPERDD
jgi:hypothetical protein